MNPEEIFVIVNREFSDEKYLTTEQLRAQQGLDYTMLTADNIAQQPRHRLGLLEGKARSEMNEIDPLRFRKSTTPKGQKPYTNNELKEFLKKFGLKVGGKKDDLIERLEDKLRDLDEEE